MCWKESYPGITRMLVHGGSELARLRGNVHAGSDRAAATLVFLILIVAVLLLTWWLGDRSGFMAFWDGIGDALNINK
jgi:hypothetical protein